MERLSLAKGGDFRHLTSAKEWLLSFGGFVANSGGFGDFRLSTSQIDTRPIT